MTLEIKGNDEETRIEKENYCIEALAIDIARGILTDDNPSHAGTTGVDQYLYCFFHTYSDAEREVLKQEALILSETISISNDEIIRKLIHDIRNPIDISSEPVSAIIDWISRLYSSGKITDGNPSPTNGLTGLDQIIEHIFADRVDDVNIIKEIVISRTIKYTGGYRRKTLAKPT